MEKIDLIGWLVFGGFLVAAATVFYFIRRSLGKLDRIVARNRTLGLLSVNPRSQDHARLERALREWRRDRAAEHKLRSVHQTRDGDAYLFTLSEKWTHREAGGSRTTSHDVSDVYLALTPTGLDRHFAVAPRPRGLGAVALSMLEKAGMPIQEVTEGLDPAFRNAFIVRVGRDEDEPVGVPDSLQEVFSRYRDRLESGQSGLEFLGSGGQFLFWPDGFAMKLMSNRRLKNVEQVRALLELAEAIRGALPGRL